MSVWIQDLAHHITHNTPWAEHLVPRALPPWAEHLVPRALPPWAEHLVPRAPGLNKKSGVDKLTLLLTFLLPSCALLWFENI